MSLIKKKKVIAAIQKKLKKYSFSFEIENISKQSKVFDVL